MLCVLALYVSELFGPVYICLYIQQVVRTQIWQCLVRVAKACLQTNVLV